MKILVTGINTNIGYNISKKLLNLNYTVVGIENNCKNKIPIFKKLKKYKKFKLVNLNLLDRSKIFKSLSNYNLDTIIHLDECTEFKKINLKPNKYINNISVFLNIVFFAKKNKITNLIYTSYFFNDEFSKYLLLIKNPNKSKNNIYLKSKLLIEKIADTYSKLSSIKFLGVRIFQDKKFLKKYKYFVKNKNNKTFSISLTEFNHMINKTLKKKKFKNEIINLCLN